ncbi:MAG: WecB/TagA/CpsF family glycosyltransferase [Acidobacteria bacterium]|nr:WecB/TagA/CpsF family glycosyltransferase [Acidobacteriota bacterium]MBI3658285.1 WecB/TagA/CpsF family glycosyltransferase [Acidobacteriota bacterium]
MQSQTHELICGFRIDIRDLARIVEDLWARMRRGDNQCVVACANPHSIALSLQDPEFYDTLRGTEILLPDGIGLLLASQLLYGRIKQRVCGPDLFLEFSKVCNERGGARYFFLGSTPEVLSQLESNVAMQFPNIRIVGTYAPPFSNVFTHEENERILSKIQSAQPEALWVGMTAPKQEKWIHRNRNRLLVPILGAIGAIFDFVAGTKKRPQKVFSDLGLEWLIRLLSDPCRLWKRSIISFPVFFLAVLNQKRRKGQAR